MTVGIKATDGYCGVTINALREQVARIEAEVGKQVSRLDAEIGTTVDANTTLSAQLAEAFLLLGSQQDLMETRKRAFEERMETLRDKVLAATEEFQERTRSLKGEIVLLKRAMVQGTPTTSDSPPAKVRMPEPKPFGSARNAKDFENFLWDMERYFIVARIPVGKQVTITTMYLLGDAKLWWRTRLSDDVVVGQPKIERWEM